MSSPSFVISNIPSAVLPVTHKLTRVLSIQSLYSRFRRPLHTMAHKNGAIKKTLDGPISNSLSMTDTMPYTNCQTRIVDLRSLRLPQDSRTFDSELCQIYRDYINAHSSRSSQTKSNNHDSQLSSNKNGVTDHTMSNETQQAQDLIAAVLSLKTGIAPPVAFPTETVYGLGADATNAASIAGIFAAKGRPSDNPLIVHVSSTEHLERCLGGTEGQSAIPQIYKELIAEFWPGPLTILIPVPEEGKGVKFAANVHPGQRTIGFRVPSSLYARFLMAVADRPIAAPSANSSGKPSPTTAQHVKDDLDGKINFILDGGPCDVGVESTVVDGLGESPVILRPGGVSKTALQSWGKRMGNVWQHVENGWELKNTSVKRKRSEPVEINGGPEMKVQRTADRTNGTSNGHLEEPIDHSMVPATNGQANQENSESSAAPRAPGMKYKHYAPKGRMLLFETSSCSTPEQNIDLVHTTLRAMLDTRGAAKDNDHSLPRPDTNLSNHSNGTVHASIDALKIGILTSTSWPQHANIDEALLSKSHPIWTVQQNTKSIEHDSKLIENIPTSDNDHKQQKQINIDTIDLGKDSATISRNLFAALRTCDDLDCDWIFAEAPTRAAVVPKQGITAGTDIETQEEDFETVLERMRKAASEVVQY